MTIEKTNKTAGAEPAEQTMESLLAEQGEMREKLQKHGVVWVKVISVASDFVLVDVGEKSEGVIPAEEFAGEAPQIGKRIPAVLVKKGRADSPTVLSTKKAKASLGWEQAAKSYEQKERVKGRVISAVKGGFLVEVGGATGFMPSSLSDIRPVRKPDALIGTGVRCYIVELDKAKQQLILSRRAVLEEDIKVRKDKILEELAVGKIRVGRVNRVGEQGLLVDIGGAEGLVSVEDLAWKDPAKALAKFSRGQKVRVRVLSVAKDTGKISLGVKQLLPHPADALKKKYAVKAVVKGKVTEVLKDGVKIELSKGDAAFCPITELPAEGGDPLERERDFDRFEGRPRADKKPRFDDNTPRIWPAVGQEVQGIVLGIDTRTIEVRISTRRYEAIQDRKQVQRYLKEAPRLTLGQLLNPDQE